MANLHNNVERKFVESFDVNDYEILTDTGWCDVARINKTIPYDVWELKTEDHFLKCADNHIVFDDELDEVFVKDLKPGDMVVTDSGDEKVVSVRDLGFSDNMYDVELSDGTNHRYYTNGILSHNSTSYNIFALWYCMFHSAKTIMMCAQREATAVELLGRIQLAYEYIPEWIKPSVVEYNKKNIEFGNMSSIKAFATKGGGARGQSCVVGSTKVTIIDNFGGIWHTAIDRVKQIANSSKNIVNNFVYKTVNKLNGRECIGVHTTDDLDDGYLGSGKILGLDIEKYGPENFERTILKFFDNRDDAFKYEAELVTEEYVKREDTYNITAGGDHNPIMLGKDNPFFEKKMIMKDESIPEWQKRGDDLMKVLTEKGFRTFQDVREITTDCLIHIRTKLGKSLSCSPTHRLKITDGRFKEAIKLSVGDILSSNDEIASIIRSDVKNEKVYDLVEVEDGNEYLTNGIASHNCNVLICDEFAFIPPNEASEFFASVYPVISSGKNSKVIIVSTPNGAQGLYYDIWTQANVNVMEPEKNMEGWRPVRIDWWEVPGRDEAWKKQQIASVGIERWQQEFECQFTSSSFQKLIPSELTDRYRKAFNKLNDN